MTKNQKDRLTSLQQTLYWQNNNIDPEDNGPTAQQVSRQLEDLLDILLGGKYLKSPWEKEDG